MVPREIACESPIAKISADAAISDTAEKSSGLPKQDAVRKLPRTTEVKPALGGI
jgi:hypothetical protein